MYKELKITEPNRIAISLVKLHFKILLSILSRLFADKVKNVIAFLKAFTLYDSIVFGMEVYLLRNF